MATGRVGSEGPLEPPELGCNLQLPIAWAQLPCGTGEGGSGEDRTVFSGSQEDPAMGMWSWQWLALRPASIPAHFFLVLPPTTYIYETNFGIGV